MPVTVYDRPQTLVSEFEDIARYTAGAAEGLRLELIGGKVRGKAGRDAEQGRVIQWLARVCAQRRPELWLNPNQGLRIGASQEDRARPDGTLVPTSALAGQGEWADPGAVLLVVEITSFESDTDRRIREVKPRAYAETGIPCYLLIDREAREVTVRSEPDGVRYQSTSQLAFGKTVRLPDPLDIAFDTRPLHDWAEHGR